MAESILEQNVVLEIAELTGTEDIQTGVQTGTITHTDYVGCADAGHGDIAFNPPYTRMHYSGDNVLDQGASVGPISMNKWYKTIGEQNPLGVNCDWPDVTTDDGMRLYPTGNMAGGSGGQKLVNIKLGNNGNEANFSYGPRHSRLAGGGQTYWDADNSQDHDDNVQGRNLYMEDNSGIRKTYIWEIFDRNIEKGELILKGNGEDEIERIHYEHPLLPFPPVEGMPQLAPEINGDLPELDWYISPWVHSEEWSSRDNQFKWDSQMKRRGKYMSYGGSETQLPWPFPNTPQYINEVANSSLLALRSDDFYYQYNIGDVSGVMDTWEVTIEVASVNNAIIQVIEGTPTDPSITPTNPADLEIKTAGSYTFCLAALQHGNNKMSVRCPSNGPGGLERFYNPLLNQANILRCEQVDSGSYGSVIIDSIKITKKKADFNVWDETVYSSGVAYSINQYDWHYLDVKESEAMPLSLTFSVGDLKDISKRATGYSKTFMLPANKHNNEILTSMLAVGAERAMIHWTKARIKVNGVHLFGGLMRVEQGDTGKGGFYKCHIIEDTIGWSQAVGDSTLCDLALLGPGGIAPPPEKSYTSVVDSWNDTPDTSDFFYGLVNYGEWSAQSANLALTTPLAHDYNHNADDFHPTVFAKAITDKIFASKGYSIQSNFFESDTFKKLCHPWVSGEEYVDGDLFGSIGSQSVTVEKNAKLTAGGTYESGGYVKKCCWIPNGCSHKYAHWYPPLALGTDQGNNWTTNAQNGGYIAPFTGTYHGTIKATMYISQSVAALSMSNMSINLHINGSLAALDVSLHDYDVDGNIVRGAPGNAAWAKSRVFGPSMHGDAGVHNGLARFIEFEIHLNAGDSVSMRLDGDNSSCYKSYQKASDMQFDIYPIPSATVPDELINLSKILPCDMKQIDYLRGLTEVFNLQWTANEETKTVYCEPYNDFFGSGKTLDWTEKLDCESWNDKFIIEELAKEITFQYKEDTGDKISNSVYRWKEREGYDIEQSHTELNDQKFRKETLKMGTEVFSTTIMFNATGTQPTPYDAGPPNGYRWGDLTWTEPTSNKNNPLMPVMWSGDGGHINTQDRPEINMEKPSFDMRLLNYYGKTDCSTWEFIDSAGVSHTETQYPHLGYINEWLKNVAPDPYSLSWGDENDGHGNTSPGLFTKYWRVAYLKMNGGSALRTCKINLNANDISTFDYRDLILLNIDGVPTYWTVNKIMDYTPNKNELTKVELIEWKQAKDFGQHRTKSKDPRKSAEPKKDILVSRSNDKGLVLRNETKNNSIGTGIAFGNGVLAMNNQTVLGNYNKPNNTDVLQVGSGIDEHERTTALTIKNTGEVEIHGGEINVEETDGIIHDLVYTDVDGNIQKLYLKKE